MQNRHDALLTDPPAHQPRSGVSDPDARMRSAEPDHRGFDAHLFPEGLGAMNKRSLSVMWHGTELVDQITGGQAGGGTWRVAQFTSTFRFIPTLLYFLPLLYCGCGNDPNSLGGLIERTVDDARSRHACGTTSGVGRLVPDCPLGTFCFTAACLAHDLCYTQCEAERAECDRRFRGDLVAACFQRLPLRPGAVTECLALALTYWSAVVELGDSFYPCNIEPPDVVDPRDGPGACCQIFEGPFCESVERASDCATDGVFVPGFDCTEVEATFGGCPVPLNDTCEQATIVCPDQPRVSDPDLGICTPTTGATGDRPCSISGQDCPGRSACLPVNRSTFRCGILSDNRLAQTDGPPADGNCLASGADRFRADVWFDYVAPCSGSLTVQMCQGTDYDAMVAIYGTNESDGDCGCPGDMDASLACDDDSCGGPGGPAVATYENAVEGACYQIRVGGWSSDGTDAATARGLAHLDIGMVCTGGP